jgi:hypothetical protein
VVVEILKSLVDRIELRPDVAGRGSVRTHARRSIAALDGTFDLRPFGRQLAVAMPFGLAGVFEFGLELGPPSTWIASTANGMSAITSSNKAEHLLRWRS